MNLKLKRKENECGRAVERRSTTMHKGRSRQMITEGGTLSADSSGNTHQLVKLEAFPSIIHRISAAAFDKNEKEGQQPTNVFCCISDNLILSEISVNNKSCEGRDYGGNKFESLYMRTNIS